MATPSRRILAFVALLALLAASSACGRFARRGAVEPTPSKAPVKYGSGVKVQDPLVRSGSSKAKTGTMEIQVVDQRTGKPMPGITVAYRGEQRGTMRTDGGGIARARLKPGKYVMKVARCGDTMVVDELVEADAVIVAGQVRRGQLFVNYAAARYRPSNSVERSLEAPWPRNKNVVLGVQMEDTCDYGNVADGAPLSHLRWRAEGLKIVSTPQRADAQGIARVTVACTAAGDAELVVSIAESDPPYEVNVIDSMSRPFSGEWCA